MNKPNPPKPAFSPAETVFLKRTLDRLLNALYHRLEWLFLLRPTVLIPVWLITAAGLSAGHWLSEPQLFWRVAWNGSTLLVFIGVTLVTGASFIQAQLKENGELAIKGYPSVMEGGKVAPETARRLAWLCLGSGLILIIPGGLPALLMGAVMFGVWGGLYGSKPEVWKGNPVVEALIHTLGGAAAFYLGWAASGAPWQGSWTIAAPYLLGFAAVSALTAITLGPHYPDDRPRPGKVKITVVLVTAAVLVLVATIWGYRNGDPVISTAAVLTLPFYVVALFYRREKDVVRTSRYSILILAVFVGARYPLLYIPLLIALYLSRHYYRRRFGFVHPSFHSDHD